MFKTITLLTTVLGMSLALNASILESAAYEVAESKIVPFENTVKDTEDYNKRVAIYKNWRTTHKINKIGMVGKYKGRKILTVRNILFETNDLASDSYNKAVTEHNKRIKDSSNLDFCVVAYRDVGHKRFEKVYNQEEKLPLHISAICPKLSKNIDVLKNDTRVIYNPILWGKDVPTNELDKRNFSYPVTDEVKG